MLIGKRVNDYLMSSYRDSLVTLSLVSNGYICWESSAYVLLLSHRINFPSPVILSRHGVTHIPAAQNVWKCSNSLVSCTVQGISVARTFTKHFYLTSFQSRLDHILSTFLSTSLSFLQSHTRSDLRCCKWQSWSSRLPPVCTE